MKCEKCKSENVKVVAHSVRQSKPCGAMFIIFAILGFILLIFGIAFLVVARNIIMNKDLLSLYFDKEQLELRLKENLTEYNQRLTVGVICFIIGLTDILFLLLIKTITSSNSEVQIIGVCLDCGETWIIPVKLKEFNEDEVYQAELKRKELKKDESENDIKKE